jgi:hypothetical protein
MDQPDDYDQASARGARLGKGVTAVSARFDERLGEIVVRLSTGVGILISPIETQGLSGANKRALSEVEITPSGLGLHWPMLDADVYLPALLEGVTGTEAWMAARLGEKGGRVSSPSKAAAARENGRLGGRPRRIDAAPRTLLPTGHVQKTAAAMMDEFFVERRGDGQYKVLKPNAHRASAVAATQQEAIAKAKALNPDATVHVERVRSVGPGRDKWRT